MTAAGESIRMHVEGIEAEALMAERTVGGRDVRLEGLMRVGKLTAARQPSARTGFHRTPRPSSWPPYRGRA